MPKSGIWRVFFLLVSACYLAYSSPIVFAVPPSLSPNYRLDEGTLGQSGLIESNSTNYKGSSSIGDLSIGEASSTNFQVKAGSQTTNDPALSFTFINSNANFGSFSAAAPTVATASFSISNYTSYGYIVQIVGNPPSNGAHTIPALGTNSSSQFGTEQFGINLVANTVPSAGLNPDQGQFGFGVAAANYNTPNSFRYVSGETIASAPKSSGVTTYTITYLVNVGSLTPGGQYASSQTIIVTGTY